MLKHCVHTLAVTLMISFATALAYAQSTDTPKLEVGAQFAFLRLRDLPALSGTQGTGESDPGVGLRVGYNLSSSFAAEAEFNYFATDLDINLGGGIGNQTYSSSRTQGFFGVKYLPLRGDKFGIGGKLRPGFVRFNGSGGALDVNIIPGIPFSTVAGGYTSFAMDIGGVFEYYPTGKTYARLDIGDTIIRLKGPIATGGGILNNLNSNNLQLNIGFGFRF
jgi:hypothetical protein